jgi:thiosulfate/3-mercaptopyruvate sulfurtransferase
MPIAQLISPQALDLKKDQPGLVILDCRFALEDPDYGQRSYAEGHIAGSSFADLERDLSGKVVKGVTGRHPLPEPAALIERLQAWGINATAKWFCMTTAWAYAARAWWLLAWLGKREGVFILDGGLKAWHGAGCR